MKRTFQTLNAALSIGILLSAALPAHAAKTVCDTPDVLNRVKKILNEESSSLSIQKMATATNSSQVVLIGDEHHSMDGSWYKEVIQYFVQVKGRSSCIALEIPNQGASGRQMLTWYKSVGEATSKILENPSITEEQRSKALYVKDNMPKMIKYFESMVATAESLGVRSITVDKTDFNLGKKFSFRERNEAMAQNLAAGLQSGCSSILFFVGRLHLAPVAYAPAIGNEIPVQDLLQGYSINGRPIKATTINMMKVYEPRILSHRTFTCSMPAFAKMQMVRSSSVFSDDNNLNPNLITAGLPFNAYDYTILVP